MLAKASHGPGSARRRGRATRLRNLADFEAIARHERDELAGLEARVGDAPVTYVPELGRDVHDFAALHAVGAHLAGGG